MIGKEINNTNYIVVYGIEWRGDYVGPIPQVLNRHMFNNFDDFYDLLHEYYSVREIEDNDAIDIDEILQARNKFLEHIVHKSIML